LHDGLAPVWLTGMTGPGIVVLRKPVDLERLRAYLEDLTAAVS